eukprot:1136709-Pelagomonas_calceolata.AAC.2
MELYSSIGSVQQLGSAVLYCVATALYSASDNEKKMIKCKNESHSIPCRKFKRKRETGHLAGHKQPCKYSLCTQSRHGSIIPFFAPRATSKSCAPIDRRKLILTRPAAAPVGFLHLSAAEAASVPTGCIVAAAPINGCRDKQNTPILQLRLQVPCIRQQLRYLAILTSSSPSSNNQKTRMRRRR